MKRSKKNPAHKSTKPPAKSRKTSKGTAKRDAALPTIRDPRLPKPGTKLVRPWHGKHYEVTVGEHDFTHRGATYRSLSALAGEITGAASINGFAWWGLTVRPAAKVTCTGMAPPKKGRAPKSKTPAAEAATGDATRGVAK